MKKILTVLSIMSITLSLSAQAKKKKKNVSNDCYLTTAVATFNLSDDDKVELNKLLTEKLEARAAVRKQIKSNEISKEEGKAQAKVTNQNYFKSVADLTGKPKKEIIAFEKSTKEKCK